MSRPAKHGRGRPADTSNALLAEPCKCPAPIVDDETCLKCGRSLQRGQQSLRGFDAFLFDHSPASYPD